MGQVAVTPVAHMQPYEGIAPFYDRILGYAGFAPVWNAFDRARRRFAFCWSRCGAADFACGTGLFLEALSKVSPAQVPLYGVDSSRSMLAEARHRLEAPRDVFLIQADIRNVRLQRPVELISCNFSTINYFITLDDLDKIMGNFASNLCYNGYLVFDMLAAGGNGIAAAAFKQRIYVPGFRAHWWVAPRPDKRGSCTVMLNCVHQGRTAWRCWVERHVQRWWPVSAIVELLARNSLKCLTVGPVERPYSGWSAPWVQVVARRL